ncbi:hypothetical protein AURDEDRAFT_132102 [Auricularia subglabra TFB-10046 SS5]|uniref:Uncharacterized protein n=1 Tax=Auricularia subglabra (strain TFB-10046 / SS5) TaxID=717982 RepID=J0WJT0_AURST|nr:hypothetical protein AURDEDRAFT_132102 [Auricularia subglabra TFB-10046 SS5]
MSRVNDETKPLMGNDKSESGSDERSGSEYESSSSSKVRDNAEVAAAMKVGAPDGTQRTEVVLQGESHISQTTLAVPYGPDKPRNMLASKSVVDPTMLPMDGKQPMYSETARALAKRDTDHALAALREVDGISTNPAFVTSRDKVVFAIENLLLNWRMTLKRLHDTEAALLALEPKYEKMKQRLEDMTIELEAAESQVDALRRTIGKRKKVKQNDEEEEGEGREAKKMKEEDEE